jgi:hypothetical protein
MLQIPNRIENTEEVRRGQNLDRQVYFRRQKEKKWIVLIKPYKSELSVFFFKKKKKYYYYEIRKEKYIKLKATPPR